MPQELKALPPKPAPLARGRNRSFGSDDATAEGVRRGATSPVTGAGGIGPSGTGGGITGRGAAAWSDPLTPPLSPEK